MDRSQGLRREVIALRRESKLKTGTRRRFGIITFVAATALVCLLADKALVLLLGGLAQAAMAALFSRVSRIESDFRD